MDHHSGAFFIPVFACRPVESGCKPCGKHVENGEEGMPDFFGHSTVFLTINVEKGGSRWIVEICAKHCPPISNDIPPVQNASAHPYSGSPSIFHQFHTPYCCCCPYLIIIIIFICKLYLRRLGKKSFPVFHTPCGIFSRSTDGSIQTEFNFYKTHL